MLILKEYEHVYVSFRELYPYPSTTYGLFGLYKYPARFIPQVVLYALKVYTEKSYVVFDPFAGYGTVGVACRLTGNDYELWDINPILSFLHSFCNIKNLQPSEVLNTLSKLRDGKKVSIPQWDNVAYWYPEAFLEELGRVKHSIESVDSPEIKSVLLLAFIKTAKHFSYADENVHKLYRSKKAIEKVADLQKKDWKSLLYEYMHSNVLAILKRLYEYFSENPKEVSHRIRAGIDTMVEELQREVDILITSPPYLQAQEYIRSTKLDLFWLGYTQEQVRQFSRREIPYRKDFPIVSIHSETYHALYQSIGDEKLKKVFRNYFMSVLGSLQKLSAKVRRRMLIFVGPVHSGEVRVPIDQILIEHFTSLGWKHVKTYIDRVKSRVMFNTKDFVNPASKRRNQRMETEHLVVLER